MTSAAFSIPSEKTERFRVLSRINEGHAGRELGALHALHRRAERDSFLAVRQMCAQDRSVVLGDTSRAPGDHLRRVLGAGCTRL